MTDAVRASESARYDYASARNCAESVLRAVQGERALPSIPESAGSGFTSGIGDAGCVCGALAGAVMLLGAYAETEDLMPEARRLRAEGLAATLHTRFKARWGSTCCRVIKRGMSGGSTEALSHCADITEYTAALTVEIIEEARGVPLRRFGPRDLTALAERLSTGILAGGAIGVLVVGLTDASGPAAPLLALPLMTAGLIVAVVGGRGAAGARALRFLTGTGMLSAAAGVILAILSPTGSLATIVATLVATASGAVFGWALGLAALVRAVVRVYGLARYR